MPVTVDYTFQSTGSELTPKTDSPVRHPAYYFEDGNLILLVENTLFNVFRSSLTRHSTVFQDILSLPGGEGKDDSNPFVLEGIRALHFERLLMVIYPSTFGVYNLSTTEEWISVLGLATQWDFNDIRALALRELKGKELTPILKIILCRKFNLGKDWFEPALQALLHRPRPLSVDEARMLRVEDYVLITQERERMRSGKFQRRRDSSANSSSGDERMPKMIGFVQRKPPARRNTVGTNAGPRA